MHPFFLKQTWLLLREKSKQGEANLLSIPPVSPLFYSRREEKQMRECRLGSVSLIISFCMAHLLRHLSLYLMLSPSIFLFSSQRRKRKRNGRRGTIHLFSQPPPNLPNLPHHHLPFCFLTFRWGVVLLLLFLGGRRRGAFPVFYTPEPGMLSPGQEEGRKGGDRHVWLHTQAQCLLHTTAHPHWGGNNSCTHTHTHTCGMHIWTSQ